MALSAGEFMPSGVNVTSKIQLIGRNRLAIPSVSLMDYSKE